MAWKQSFFMKKIIDFFKLKKKVIGCDNFSGFPNCKIKKSKKGKYIESQN